MPNPEPWLSSSRTDIAAIPRAVLHALDLARADIVKWCGELSAEQLCARPSGLPPIAFHLRHIARSMDRLLTYAEGRPLSAQQIAGLKTELDGEGDAPCTHDELFAELDAVFAESEGRILALAAAAQGDPSFWEQTRTVGSRGLPTTAGGLLVHVADHTLRHVGQAITTAKVVRG